MCNLFVMSKKTLKYKFYKPLLDASIFLFNSQQK